MAALSPHDKARCTDSTRSLECLPVREKSRQDFQTVCRASDENPNWVRELIESDRHGGMLAIFSQSGGASFIETDMIVIFRFGM